MRNRLAAAACALVLMGCSDATAPQDDAVGVYSMTSLNGIIPPVPLGAFYGYTLEYTSSQLSLAADNSYHERSIITARVDGDVVEVDTSDAFGLWSQSKQRIALRDVEGSDSLFATLKNGSLTLDIMIEDSLYHYVYHKN